MPAALYVEWLETQTTSALWLEQAARLRDARGRQPGTYPSTGSRSARLLRCGCCRSWPSARPDPISMTLLYSDAMIESLLPYDEALSEKFMHRPGHQGYQPVRAGEGDEGRSGHELSCRFTGSSRRSSAPR